MSPLTSGDGGSGEGGMSPLYKGDGKGEGGNSPLYTKGGGAFLSHTTGEGVGIAHTSGSLSSLEKRKCSVRICFFYTKLR